MTEPYYCPVHDWKPIGEVGTGNGVLAIVAPYFAHTLGEWWNDYLGLPVEERRPDAWKVKQLRLRQETTKHNGLSYQDQEAALLVPCENGTYQVEARFCELYGDGHLFPCELRVDLHRFEHASERAMARRDAAHDGPLRTFTDAEYQAMLAAAGPDPDPDDDEPGPAIDTAAAWQDLHTALDITDAKDDTRQWAQARVAEIQRSVARQLDGIDARARQLGLGPPPVAGGSPAGGA